MLQRGIFLEACSVVREARRVHRTEELVQLSLEAEPHPHRPDARVSAPAPARHTERDATDGAEMYLIPLATEFFQNGVLECASCLW